MTSSGQACRIVKKDPPGLDRAIRRVSCECAVRSRGFCDGWPTACAWVSPSGTPCRPTRKTSSRCSTSSISVLDEEIRSRAEIVLDLLLFDVARFAHNGNFAPTSGRCYANQKMCGYEPGIGDLVEILFGTRSSVIVWGGATSAGAFASSRRYVVPDVLIRIGQDRPGRLIDRSRVSLRFDEAAPYGAGSRPSTTPCSGGVAPATSPSKWCV